MIDSSYEFFTLEKNLSSPLKLGRAACKLITALNPTPNLEGQRTSLCLVSTVQPV